MRGLPPLLAVLAPCAGPAPALAQQDPFAEGIVWTWEAQAGTPWIPERARFAGRTSLVWAAARGLAPRLAALDEPGLGAVAPRVLDVATPASASHVDAASGRRADALFALHQRPDPTPSERRTTVHRHDPVAASTGAAFLPAWTWDPGFRTNGPARVACDADGATVAAAIWDSTAGGVHLALLDGDTGAVRATADLPGGSSLQALAVSGDGSRVALTTGLVLFVLDGGGDVVLETALPVSTPALAVSGDGRVLAHGGGPAVTVLAEDPAGAWSTALAVGAPASQVASRLDLSPDGGVLAVGWWDHVAQNRLRLEVRDVAGGTPLNDHTTGGGPLQNLPAVVRLTPDGSRVALGSWGDGAAAPEVLLFAVGQDEPLLELDVPGSVHDLDLDEWGTRLAVAHKDGHANQTGATGGVLLAQTGERSLDQRQPLRIGRSARFDTRWPGASAALLLVGERTVPSVVGGATGLLHLDRSTLVARIAPAVAGKATLGLAVPSDPAWVGRHVAVQAAFRAGGGTFLGSAVLEPVVLGR